MRSTSLLPLLLLILGHLLLPTFATPRPYAPLMQRKVGWSNKNEIEPAYLQTFSPTPTGTAAPPADTPSTPLNGTTGDDSGSDTQSNPASKEGSTLNSVNAGVAFAPRDTLFLTGLAGVIATSLMF